MKTNNASDVDVSAFCVSIIDNLLSGSNFKGDVRQSETEDSAWRKRPAIPGGVSRFKYMKFQEDENLSKKIKSLPNEMKVLTGIFKFVSEERDHWRFAADEAKKETNSLAAQNYEMNLANMEMSKMLENQNKDCLELINHLMEMLWSSTSGNVPCAGIQFYQVNTFLKFGAGLVTQVLEDQEPSRDVGDISREVQLLHSFVGCLVNLSSNKNTLTMLLNLEEISCLVTKLVELMDRSRDTKLAHLQLMFILNILNSDHQFKATPQILTAETRMKLHNIANQWEKRKEGNQSFLDIVDILQISLGHRNRKTSYPEM